MSRFNIVKKCLDAMTADQQDEIIDSCVTIVTNGSGRAIPSSAKPTKRAKAASKPGPKPKAKKPLEVKGEQYKSFSSLCEKNNLKKNSLYPKFKKIKTPAAKTKFLESCLDS